MKTNKVSMTKKAFVKEHKELVYILKINDKCGIKIEIKEQSRELKKVIKKK
jgi:hypothetical protein